MNAVWWVRTTINFLLTICVGGNALAQRTPGTEALSSVTSSSLDSSLDSAAWDRQGSSAGLPGRTDQPAAPKASRVVAPSAGSQQVDLYREPVRPFSNIAVGLEFGTLGVGIQAATPLTRTLNLRAGADFLNFGSGFAVDAAHYESEAHLRSGHLSVDWHPLGGGFRISPEMLFFESGFSASVYVTAGSAFELGNTNYVSSATDPVHGGASISMGRSVMPALTLGFGNVLGQRRRHWTIPFEIGAAYTGHYTLNLDLAGTACQSYIGCMSTSSQQVQTSVHQEESDINETMKHFQVYPIVSTGFAYRF